MANEGIVQKLIQGSAKINQMRVEIRSITELVIAFLKADSMEQWRQSQELEDLIFESTDCKWLLHMAGNPDNGGVEISCFLKTNGMRTLGYSNGYIDTGYDKLQSLVNVLRVHDALAVLIDGMFTAFPGLGTIWAPLLEAGHEKSNDIET